MAKRKTKNLPPLTPRAREVVTSVVNTVALGTHDHDAEIGALGKQLGSTPAHLRTIVRRFAAQGWLTLKNDFVYPTIAALRWQNPELAEREADKIICKLK
jgi:hypothetical protein